MSNRCILCQLTQGHGDPTSGVGSILMTPCQMCRLIPTGKVARYVARDALHDEKTLVLAVTSTLKPKLQCYDPESIHDRYYDMIKNALRNQDSVGKTYHAAYAEFTFEFTKQGALHAHGYICARKILAYKIVARLRRLGFVSIKEVFDLQEWLKYMYKDQEEWMEDSLPAIKLSS